MMKELKKTLPLSKSQVPLLEEHLSRQLPGGMGLSLWKPLGALTVLWAGPPLGAGAPEHTVCPAADIGACFSSEILAPAPGLLGPPLEKAPRLREENGTELSGREGVSITGVHY